MELKLYRLYVILWLFSKPVLCQNLVPNPGFEELLECPDNQSQLGHTKYWFELHNTPDFFHSCCLKPHKDWEFTPAVPSNTWGYQYPSEGKGYAGAFCGGPKITSTPLREYLGVKLLNPLQTNFYYIVAFKTNLANNDFAFNQSYASNNIGALFNFGIVDSIPNKAHVYSAEVLEDTANWVYISGRFKADTNYTHLGLGNFFDDFHTKRKQLGDKTDVSYYYFDDIIVREVPEIVTKDTIICEGDSVLLFGTFSGENVIWEYNIDNNGNGYSTKINPLLVKPKQTTTYKFFDGQDSRYCDYMTIYVYKPPVVNLGADTNICQNQSILLNAYNPGAKYLWNTGEKTSSITVSKPGIYYVKATIGSCVSTDTIIVGQLPEEDCFEYVNIYPNPFTENFHIAGNFIAENGLKINIIDALGREIGSSKIPQLKGRFDHLINASTLLPGVYFIQLFWGNKYKIYKMIKV